MEEVSFLNRDHIVLVTISEGEIVVTTTTGEKISYAASANTIAKFSEDLANDVQSNFVLIAAEAR
jgi:hypothetical protein